MESPASHVEILDSTQRSRWEEEFKLLPSELRDINFSFDYNFLFEKNGDGAVRLFLYKEADLTYYYPFLLRSVIVEGNETEFKDIETVYGYTGPIANTNDIDFLQRAAESFKSYCKEQKVICEFVRFHPLLGNQNLVSVNMDLKIFPLREYVYVDLRKTEQEIWDGFSAQNRNKIRKAEKLGVSIDAEFSHEKFSEFVKIYLANMKQVNAGDMYFFSVNFFKALEELVQKDGIFFVAKNQDEILGGAVFLVRGDISHYFLASATAAGKKLAAGNLLLYHGIKWGQQNGMKKLHLGGGVSDDVQDPLLVFKSNFSEQKEKFYIGKRIHDQEVYTKIVADWDRHFPDAAIKYKNILQRYRLTKKDLS